MNKLRLADDVLWLLTVLIAFWPWRRFALQNIATWVGAGRIQYHRSRLWPRGQRQTVFNRFKLGKNDQAIGMGYSHCCSLFLIKDFRFSQLPTYVFQVMTSTIFV